MTILPIERTLCVGIPTYNRPEALCRRIMEINTYPDGISEILICDNSDETSPIVLDFVEKSIVKCTYIKNVANIGAGANFLRVLENANSDYLWWRGDDDVISADQVNAVMCNLTKQPKLLILNHSEKQTYTSAGLQSFIDNFSKVESMVWASQVIIPVKIAKMSLSWGYRSIDWAHVMIILRLFHTCPNLGFTVAPYELRLNEFRDVGREGLEWPFFNTTIMLFPTTANALQDKSIRNMYISKWKHSKKYYPLIRTMIGMKLGISNNEVVSISTFIPLLSIRHPSSSILAILLYILSRFPKSLYQILFAIYWTQLPSKAKEDFRIDFMLRHTTFLASYKALRRH